MTQKQINIVAFAGSTRKDSFNKKLVKIAAAGAQNAGANVTYIDLKDYPLPLFDEDLEKEIGYPENAEKLKEIFTPAHALLIASPEYNSGYSAVLKNTIDWLSRPSLENEKPLSAFAGKFASIMATSPGALGGLRGLYQLRELLQNIQVTVLPNMRAIGQAHAAFDKDGNLTDQKQQTAVQQLGTQTVNAIH